jgi:hypothetical protein
MRCPEVILPSTPNQLAFFRAMAPSKALRGPGGFVPAISGRNCNYALADPSIPRSRDNPKILGRHDAEIVGDRIA